jgi:hypothetical protein
MPPRKGAPASGSAGPSKRARVEDLGNSAVGAGGQGYEEDDLEEVKVRYCALATRPLAGSVSLPRDLDARY